MRAIFDPGIFAVEQAVFSLVLVLVLVQIEL